MLVIVTMNSSQPSAMRRTTACKGLMRFRNPMLPCFAYDILLTQFTGMMHNNILARIDKTRSVGIPNMTATPGIPARGRGRPDRRRALRPPRCQEGTVSTFAMYAALVACGAGMIWAGWYFGGKLETDT